jgi:glycosyltransferase involved in cell wall biosynthesis
MRILVDALPLRHGGGVTHLENELAALARVDSSLEFNTLISPWSQLSGLPGIVETVSVRSVAHRFAYEQMRLGSRDSDLLYCPANFGPFFSKVPVILTIQNANYYRAGLTLGETRASRPIWKVKANHLAMRRADSIVAVSHSLAEDASKTVAGVEHKLHVVYHGAPEWPVDMTPHHGLPDVYALSVGSGAPHKHVDDVVAGWALARELSATRVSLVLIGGFAPDQLIRHRAAAGRYAEDVIHLGVINDRSVLRWIYAHALVMVLMSSLESFSLTPLEAGSVGCRLVLSDIPVHREIVGDKALFISPGDVSSLAEALAFQSFNGAPDIAAWTWPVSWDDHARQMSQLFASTVAGQPIGAGR